MPRTQGFGRAMLLMTASSALVPAVGLFSAPILARALGVDGRGEAAAAVAPNLLIVGVATLGLPEALTYGLAKRPWLAARALRAATLYGALLGVVSVAALFATAPLLAADDSDLARLMVLGGLLAVPTLVVNLLRGAASGQQMWAAVALERTLNSVLRLTALVVLFAVGQLDVLNAVLVMTIVPALAGLAYVRVLSGRRQATTVEATSLDVMTKRRIGPELLNYGSRIWVGSVANVVQARLGALVITPLSDVRQLGLFVVAVTVADVPFIIVQTIRDVVFGAESERSNAARLAGTCRIVTLMALTGAAVLGGTLPLWLTPLFGQGFRGALPVSWLLLLSTVVTVPGLIAGAGLASAGRPGLRSVALTIALVTNALGLVVLVPQFGAFGAAAATLTGSFLASTFGLISATRLLGVPLSNFVVPRMEDLRLIRAMAVRVTSRVPLVKSVLESRNR